MPRLTLAIESFPLASRFVISRGAKSVAEVVVATLDSGHARGRGECVPYARYGESPASVLAQIEMIRPAIEAGAGREVLQELLPPGAARNALDCALWDLEAKETGVPVYRRAGLSEPVPAVTAYTISVGTPETMAEAAAKASHRPLLKLKLAGEGDLARIAAVRAAAPEATLIVDANEAWTETMLGPYFEACAAAGVKLIEQPLPAGQDAMLAKISRPVSICADESAHDRDGLEDLAARYDMINVKLDKTGGLTEALCLVEAARGLKLDIMLGCMVASSLAMAPAMLLASQARFVDLDGPLLLAKDRPHGLTYEGSLAYPPAPDLWG
ncbi:N-acetyl-D-Glu racemase DgcA [Beijerinckia indica]|uniref:Dipeptide epimerase n=1 Tax=Beijerinckia indica subsp. indica (strain ATCC 9039 / DSM 1715 / NCIMB 8712) TaxID=395963 RepID=B2IEN2_BEII9|nr:N-acetyl-D-Glu racemase DgcA [Beijerinckia indica]ACB96972.1 Mandelate racemase/muconate lactonizing protein [Beijerinckia indica subsp. indica ATCC 9039]